MKYWFTVQAFTEVGGDRRLDDRAVRTRHQATHAGELADLRGGTTRAGVGVHEDGVEGGLLLLLAVAAFTRSVEMPSIIALAT